MKEPIADVFAWAFCACCLALGASCGAGRFAFNAVKPGRYLIGVVSKQEGAFTPADVTFLQRPEDEFDTLVFDVGANQQVDLGKVRAKQK